MSMLRAIALFLCGFLSLRTCRAQTPVPGACPNVTAMTDFNLNRYLGKWYEAEKFFAIFELGGKCVTAEYSEKDNGVVGVLNKQISSITGKPSEIQGEATLAGRPDEGKLSVVFPSVPGNFAAPYWVVDTDYDNYALVWSCNNFGIFHTQNAWILTRERNPPLSVMENAYQASDSNNINRANFKKTDQENCPDN